MIRIPNQVAKCIARDLRQKWHEVVPSEIEGELNRILNQIRRSLVDQGDKDAANLTNGQLMTMIDKLKR